MTWVLATLIGALGGAGILLLVQAVAPAQPRLDLALDRLTGAERPHSDQSPLAFLAGWAERHRWIRAPEQDLELAGWTRAGLLTRKLTWTTIGVAAPLPLAFILKMSGIGLPVLLPLLASLCLGALFFMLPDAELKQRASDARQEIRHAVCAYLDMVALERAAGSGPVEALEEAARHADAPAFTRIAAALRRVQLAGRPAWDGLSELSESLAVPALTDVADIVRLSGEDGAGVYHTLRARAAGLRAEMLTDAATQANADSERLVIPASLTVIVFIAFIGAPVLGKLLFP
jgi:pilus assembly protein TadC